MKKLLFLCLLILFNNFSFSQNENIKLLVENTKELNLEMFELTKFAEKNLNEKADIAKFFYYWIGTNIKYDYDFLKKMDENFSLDFGKEYQERQHPYSVYTNRKGVCGGYANLFKWFLEETNIEVEIVNGHIRDERNHYIELMFDSNFSHAWNAVKLDDKWILVDTTWGTSYNPEQSEFYFDIKPELAINTHYPENSKWQLLKKPLSLEDFNKSKFVKLIWFFSGFSDIPKLKQDNNYYYFVHKTNKKDKNLSVELEISQDNLNFNKIKNTLKIDQDNYTYIRFKKDSIPKQAFYKVNVYDYNYNSPSYENVISFKTE